VRSYYVLHRFVQQYEDRLNFFQRREANRQLIQQPGKGRIQGQISQSIPFKPGDFGANRRIAIECQSSTAVPVDYSRRSIHFVRYRSHIIYSRLVAGASGQRKDSEGSNSDSGCFLDGNVGRERLVSETKIGGLLDEVDQLTAIIVLLGRRGLQESEIIWILDLASWKRTYFFFRWFVFSFVQLVTADVLIVAPRDLSCTVRAKPLIYRPHMYRTRTRPTV